MILSPELLKSLILYSHLLIALAQVSEDTLKDPLKEPKTPSTVLFRAERIESLQKKLWILEAMENGISGVLYYTVPVHKSESTLNLISKGGGFRLVH